MRMSKPVSLFLLAFGVWSWIIWVTFARNLWQSDNARDTTGTLTSFFWVHAALTVVSIILGTIIGAIGWRGLRALTRRTED
ncbi:SCO4848 family membrane protein [Haloechinothrix salitolerans]|uniref:SCO4848 family membrane protein n=1 Tax=Haloechinothrix salitolerans TaxID=926830 RepID=A0ABW2C9N5_9PSEU